MVTCAAPDAEETLLADLQRNAPASFGAMFLERARRTPEGFSYRRPAADGTWRAQTWAETAQAVREIAAGLLELGLRPQDRVAIAAPTRVEWIEADFGVMCAGGATTTVYPSSSAEEIAHILTDSGSRIAIVEDAALAEKVRPHVEHVIVIDGDGDTLARLRERGREALAADPELVDRSTAAIAPDHLATLIYTSGTTGTPKGVCIPHSAWVYQGLAIEAMGIVGPGDVAYLWLPLSHAFGKALLSCQLSVGFEFAVDGDVSAIVRRLGEVRPTIMPAVPRIFEKVYAAVTATGGIRGRLLTWAIKAGHTNVIADRLVLSKVRDRFGGRMRYFICGASALSPDIAAWFDAVGLPVAEGYGLTESCATTVFNRPRAVEYGTVGRPLPGTRVTIAEDGEILLKGPGLMSGYHGLPSDDTLRDGWLRTGDIGEITERGSLRVTDRKKDLIKTSNGKYVAPGAVEARIKALCPLVGQVIVHGDNRKFVTALIDLDPDEAAKRGLGSDFSAISQSDEIRHEISACIDRLNADLNPWETIKKFTVLDHHLAIDQGELTPSLKLRRRVVEQRYREQLDSMYT
ncbi:long-chain fatty acid--CoA ligase [Actinoplanes sp. NBRC 101535]|uniref:AMP-dependent synthetase/ligase n=1 Tax=Actinoplanes sp. NBRC 101535 TaxID=3032196 RepID=UPI0024A1858D|nr:long-chain fatty acid--CoA ligase [Actinoplanes sp. NBRC 101535]GLY00163.1 AMP-dependent synthetase [Actinoplanes sp. NBRC 101535]